MNKKIKNSFSFAILIIIVAVLCFCLNKYINIDQNIYSSKITSSSPIIKIVSTSSPTVSVIKPDKEKYNPFITHGAVETKHSVYRFGFMLDIPDWMVENWKWGLYNIGNDQWNIILNSNTDPEGAFSGIYVFSEASREYYNANTKFEYEKAQEGKDYGGKLIYSEILLNLKEDMRIYHLQYQFGENGFIQDVFYFDNDTNTVRVKFESDLVNYQEYGRKVKEFVQGFNKFENPQG